MAGTATTDIHSIVLEAWYLRGGATPPVEYVPSTDKEVLNLDDNDNDNDLILPFGIRYKYRIRAVDVLGREGLPVETEALLPMQDGLPPTVLIFPHLSDYDPLPVEGTQVIDEEACRQDYGPEFLAECLAGEDSDYVRTSGPQPSLRLLPNPSAQIELFRGCAAWEQQADADGKKPHGLPDSHSLSWILRAECGGRPRIVSSNGNAAGGAPVVGDTLCARVSPLACPVTGICRHVGLCVTTIAWPCRSRSWGCGRASSGRCGRRGRGAYAGC